MEIFTEIVAEVVEEAAEAALTSERVPKVVRCIFLGIVCVICAGFGIFMATQTDFIPGIIVSAALSVLFIVLGIVGIVRILRPKKNKKGTDK